MCPRTKAPSIHAVTPALSSMDQAHPPELRAPEKGGPAPPIVSDSSPAVRRRAQWSNAHALEGRMLLDLELRAAFSSSKK